MPPKHEFSLLLTLLLIFAYGGTAVFSIGWLLGEVPLAQASILWAMLAINIAIPFFKKKGAA